jgi:hypothetical protein
MTEIMRQAPCVLAIIRKLIPCGMPQHMRMNLERKVRSYAGTLDHSQEPSCCYWSASFGHEYIRTVALEWPQGSEFRTVQRMHTLLSALHPIDMQATMPEIDLCPTERAKLRGS